MKNVPDFFRSFFSGCIIVELHLQEAIKSAE